MSNLDLFLDERRQIKDLLNKLGANESQINNTLRALNNMSYSKQIDLRLKLTKQAKCL